MKKQQRRVSELLYLLAKADGNMGDIEDLLATFSPEETSSILNNSIFFAFANMRDVIDEIIKQNKEEGKGIKERSKFFDPDSIMGIYRKNKKEIEFACSKRTAFTICPSSEIDYRSLCIENNPVYPEKPLPHLGPINRNVNGKSVLAGLPNSSRYLADSKLVTFEGVVPFFLPKKYSDEEILDITESEILEALEQKPNSIKFNLNARINPSLFIDNNGVVSFERLFSALGKAAGHNSVLDTGNFFILSPNRSAQETEHIAVDKNWLKALYETLTFAEETKKDRGITTASLKLDPSLNLYTMCCISSLTSNYDHLASFAQAKQSEAYQKQSEAIKNTSTGIQLRIQKGADKSKIFTSFRTALEKLFEEGQIEYDQKKPSFKDNFLCPEVLDNEKLTANQQIKTTLALQSAFSTFNELYEKIVYPYRKKRLANEGWDFLSELMGSNIFRELCSSKALSRFDGTTGFEIASLGKKRADYIDIISIVRNALQHSSFEINPSSNPLDKNDTTFVAIREPEKEERSTQELRGIHKLNIRTSVLLDICANPLFNNIPKNSGKPTYKLIPTHNVVKPATPPRLDLNHLVFSSSQNNCRYDRSEYYSPEETIYNDEWQK